MSDIMLHPGLILILAAVLAAFLPDFPRRILMVFAPFSAIVLMLLLPQNTIVILPFLNGLVLTPVFVDRLSYVFGMIFSIMSLIGSIYSLHNRGIIGKIEAAASLSYAGSSLGVTLAGDWISLIFFWELMAVSSLFLVWANRSKKAERAGFRYLLMHMLGGNCLLIGIIFKVSDGSTAISNITAVQDAAFWLIFIGVAVNAAIPPLSGWLTDAYPEANVTGSVFLSSFTTKTAVYCMIRMFAEMEMLVWLGVAMALYGAMFAIMENDVRRLLSYHIVSQVGFMVAGVGIGTPLSLNGATAHAFSHILYKSLLFMSTGAVIAATGVNKINQLGGLAKKMPFTCIAFTVGAFSISGVPLFNGFISKSITITAAYEAGYEIAELLLLAASVGTFLCVVMKLLYFIFFGEDKNLAVKPVPFNMKAAMGIGSALCILYGIFPNLLYRYLPFTMEYHPFTWDHVLQYVQLLSMAVIPFILYGDRMKPLSKISLDTDWFYRKPFATIIRNLSSLCVTVQLGLGGFFRGIYNGMRKAAMNPLALLGTDRTEIMPGAEAEFREAENECLASGETDAATSIQSIERYNPDEAREPAGEIMTVVIFTLIVLIALIALKPV